METLLGIFIVVTGACLFVMRVTGTRSLEWMRTAAGPMIVIGGLSLFFGGLGWVFLLLPFGFYLMFFAAFLEWLANSHHTRP